MTKEQMIERYRRGYATDEHLDTAVARGLLTVEEAESLNRAAAERGNRKARGVRAAAGKAPEVAGGARTPEGNL